MVLATFQTLSSHWTTQMWNVSVTRERSTRESCSENPKNPGPHSNKTTTGQSAIRLLSTGHMLFCWHLTPFFYLRDLPSSLDAISKPCLALTCAKKLSHQGPNETDSNSSLLKPDYLGCEFLPPSTLPSPPLSASATVRGLTSVTIGSV